jgi:type IV pilus assembly protein PilP
MEMVVYSDEDFAELDVQNRDPFRSFAKAFKAQAAAPAQRRVLLPSTSLDEMRLIAIVTGIATPRAMMTDTSDVGHVVRRGDYIGRPEVVKTGGAEGMPVTLNWRVDRIRPGSVVLTREDPTAPDKPPLTRVMPLHEGGEPVQLATP